MQTHFAGIASVYVAVSVVRLHAATFWFVPLVTAKLECGHSEKPEGFRGVTPMHLPGTFCCSRLAMHSN